MREWVLAAAIVLIALGVAMQLGQREGRNMVAGERNDDETCEEILRTKVNQDVAEWRKTGQPALLGEQNRETSDAILDALFAAGAVRIIATDVEKDPRFGLGTNWIIVEMPTDQLSRRRLDQLLRVLSKKNGWAAEGAGNGRYALLGKFKFTFRWP